MRWQQAVGGQRQQLSVRVKQRGKGATLDQVKRAERIVYFWGANTLCLDTFNQSIMNTVSCIWAKSNTC